MDYKGYIAIGISIVAVVVAFAIGGNTIKETVTEQVFRTGAAAGPEHYNRQYFNAGSTNGGRLATSTTAASYTTVAADFNGTPSFLEITPAVNLTLSLSGTSTHAYVPNVGDTAVVYVRNASTTAASTITFAAADAGVDLQEDEGETVVVNGLEVARLNLIRKGQNNVIAWIEAGQVGD